MYRCRECKEEFKSYTDFHKHKVDTGHHTVDQVQSRLSEVQGVEPMRFSRDHDVKKS